MKKTKLILSLAMMCLSVAVLCFGVLAANSVTYSISGTISYEVNDVFVKINTSVYAITEQQDKSTVIATVEEMESVSQANSLTINSKTYTRTQTMVEYDSTNATTDPATGSVTGIDLTYGGESGYYTYYIIINIQNLSSSKNVSAYIEEGENMSAETYSVKTTNLYQNNISSNQAKNVVIAYTIKDKASSISNVNIDYKLNVSYTEYIYPYASTLQKDDNGYYISLGTGYKLTGTSNTVDTDLSPVIWRLVSLDGVSKYTYDSTNTLELVFNTGNNMRYLSDAVFLQETAVGSTLVFNSSGQNYYSSSIRTSIKDGSCFNLTSTNLSYIKDRDLGDKLYKYSYSGDLYNRVGVKQTSYVSRPEGDTTKDKFWLLDMEEVNTFVSDTYTSRKWMNSDGKSGVGFWLRSPHSDNSNAVCHVGVAGTLNFTSANYTNVRIRAAFQLA